MLGDVKKLFVFKSLLTAPHLKQTFPPIIWIFTEGEGDGIESRPPFIIFSTQRLFHKGSLISESFPPWSQISKQSAKSLPLALIICSGGVIWAKLKTFLRLSHLVFKFQKVDKLKLAFPKKWTVKLNKSTVLYLSNILSPWNLA